MSAYSPDADVDDVTVTDSSIVFVSNSSDRVEFIPHNSISAINREQVTVISCLTTPPYYLLLLPLIYLGGIGILKLAPTMMMFHAIVTTALIFPFIITTYSIQQKLRAHLTHDERTQIVTNAGDVYHIFTDSETATNIVTEVKQA